MPCKLSVIARSPDFLQCRIGLSGACCRSSTSFCSPHLSSATTHFPSSTSSHQCCQRPYILLPPIYDPTMAYAENIRMIQCISQLPASATECAGKFSHHQLLALLVSKSGDLAITDNLHGILLSYSWNKYHRHLFHK